MNTLHTNWGSYILISLNVQNPQGNPEMSVSHRSDTKKASHLPTQHTHTRRYSGRPEYVSPHLVTKLKLTIKQKKLLGMEIYPKTRIGLPLLTCKVKQDDGKHTRPHFYRQASTCSAPKVFPVFVLHSGHSSQLQRERN